MSITRHDNPPRDPDPDNAYAPVVGRLEQWLPEEAAPHRHRRHQLMCAANGVIHVTTDLGEWVLPATRAIWVSSGTEHATQVKRPTHTRVLYIDPDAYDMPKEGYCLVVAMTPLMREVMTACAGFPWDYAENTPQSRLARVLIDQVTAMDHSPVDLPFPTDPRATRLAKILRSDPANRLPLEVLAKQVGASPRTIERLFSHEAGMSFGNWRHRQRLLTAMEYLAYGESVTNVALNVGYESASSFVAAFKAVFGSTPARYFKSAT